MGCLQLSLCAWKKRRTNARAAVPGGNSSMIDAQPVSPPPPPPLLPPIVNASSVASESVQTRPDGARAENSKQENGTKPNAAGTVIPLDGPVMTLHEKRPSRLFALIIGINDYSSLPKLSGSINDAKAVELFLKSSRHIPTDRIRLLLDQDASRQGIVDAFKQLSVEDDIEMDDPILIYYAGHGTQLDSPKGWEASGPGRKIQGIMPCDYMKGSVNAIPDRTLGTLLDLICENKGNNITVIMDCCHSASGTRADVPMTDVRGVVLDDILPTHLDRLHTTVSLGRSSQSATRFGVRGLGSHVLISACQTTETAKEEKGRGRFTIALLELFNEEGRLENLTYSDILKHIKRIPNQNPQIEGIHRDRIIFNAKGLRRRPLHNVRLRPQDGTYTLDAGSVHGVAMGFQFIVYKDEDSFLRSSPWGMLVVLKAMTSTSILRRNTGTTSPDLEQPGVAVLSSGGASQALVIMASFDPAKLPLPFLDTLRFLEKQNVISLVGMPGNAELEMHLEDGSFVFNILLPDVTACGLNRVYHTMQSTDPAAITGVLSAGSNFFWHLRRGHDHPMINSIQVEFVELTPSEDEFDDAGNTSIIPSKENLLRHGAIDLYVGSNDDADADSKRYGIRLTNDSVWDLFPAAFYYNHSDWSIDTYYHPGTAGQFRAEAPLQKNGGTLTIGFGAGGSDPIAFRLDHEGQDLDVGHMKIFFSTKEVDLRHIEQESPFTGLRSTRRAPHAALDSWATIQYPIIQRRAF